MYSLLPRISATTAVAPQLSACVCVGVWVCVCVCVCLSVSAYIAVCLDEKLLVCGEEPARDASNNVVAECGLRGNLVVQLGLCVLCCLYAAVPVVYAKKRLLWHVLYAKCA